MRKSICALLAMLICVAAASPSLALIAPMTSDLTYEFNSDGTVTVLGYRNNAVHLAELNIPSSVNGMPVSAIAPDAFSRDPWLRTLRIPGSVKSIGGWAFAGASNLENVYLADGLMSIGELAFGVCGKLRHLSLPNSVETVESMAFARCGLESVTLSERMVDVTTGAFAECSALSSIVIPTGIRRIGSLAFSECALSHIILPAGIQEVGDDAFGGCPNLLYVTLPQTITTLGTAFHDSPVKRLIYDGTQAQWNAIVGKMDESPFSDPQPDILFLREPVETADTEDLCTPVTVPNDWEPTDAATPPDPVSTENVAPWEPVPPQEVRRLNGQFTFQANGHSIDIEEARESIRAWAREAFGPSAEVRFDSEAALNSRAGCARQRSAGLATGDRANVYVDGECVATYEIIIRGDVQGTGAPGLTQLVRIVQAIRLQEEAPLTAEQIAAADVDGNGAVSLTDAVLYAKYLTNPDDFSPVYPDAPVLTAWESNNAGRQNYINFNRWAAPVTSHLFATDHGTLTRVEYTTEAIVVEEYSAKYQLLSSRQIPIELSKWGGFYAGEKYYYFIFGQDNAEADPDKEVIRIVQYDYNWNRTASDSLYGANTTQPFLAGSLRCTEYKGFLYVHSCHNMFPNKDGEVHQANLMIALEQDPMRITDTETGVVWGTGFVSHSFNQFVLVDRDGKLVILDHGDGHPRSVTLRKYIEGAGQKQLGAGDGQTLGVDGADLQELAGPDGDNDTGCFLGGFQETRNGYVAAYGYDGKGTRNESRDIYLAFVDRQLKEIQTVQITDEVDAQLPMLVSTDDAGGYVLWEQTPAGSRDGQQLAYACYDEDGLPGKVTLSDARMSDCQPVLWKGKVIWYVTQNGAPTFYELTDGGIEQQHIFQPN